MGRHFQRALRENGDTVPFHRRNIMQLEHRRRADLRLTTSRMATPPPAPMDRYPEGIGWVDAHAIGFRGFNDEQDAAHAAVVAYRAMEEHLTGGRAFAPLDTSVPPTIARNGDIESVVVGKRPIARLIRLGSLQDGASGSIAFELEVPVPVTKRTLRSAANHLYEKMKARGVMPGGNSRAPATNASRDTDGIDEWLKGRMVGILAIIIVVWTAYAIVVATSTVSASLIVAVLGGIAAVLATVALASRVRTMQGSAPAPARTSRRRKTTQPRWHSDTRFWYAAGSAGARHL